MIPVGIYLIWRFRDTPLGGGLDLGRPPSRISSPDNKGVDSLYFKCLTSVLGTHVHKSYLVRTDRAVGENQILTQNLHACLKACVFEIILTEEEVKPDTNQHPLQDHGLRPLGRGAAQYVFLKSLQDRLRRQVYHSLSSPLQSHHPLYD